MANKMPWGSRNRLKRMIRDDYLSIHDKGGYRLLGFIWGVTTPMAWRLINEKDYWPKDPKYENRLFAVAKQRGLDKGEQNGRE